MNLYLISGLVLDFIGVTLLGIDLIRFQIVIQKRAKKVARYSMK